MSKVTTRTILSLIGAAVCCLPTLSAGTITVTSLDVPKSILDNNPAGVTSTLIGPALTNLTDVNLIFNNLTHTSVSDLRITLTSPFGTTTVLVKAFTESGILTGLGTPVNFINTVLDDQALTNLAAGAAPYTGSFNINHASVVANPLSTFNGQNASGTWTLFISDLASGDSGTLNAWSLQFTGTDVPEPATLGYLALGLVGIMARIRSQRRA